MSSRKRLRRKAASEYLREMHGVERSHSTLAKLAVVGGGPMFERIGRKRTLTLLAAVYAQCVAACYTNSIEAGRH